MTNIERNVMRRVHIIHTLRPIVSGSMFSMVVAVLALYGIGKEVWVARVVENAPESVSLLPQFYFAAFLHTHVAVQILSLAVIVSVIYLARETAKLITSSLIFVRA